MEECITTLECLKIIEDHFLSNVKFLSDLPLKMAGHVKVYRYMRYSHLKEMLDKKNLVFLSPSLWEDKLEKRYLDTDFSCYGFAPPPIACLCVTTSANQNSAAAWKMYMPKEEGLDKPSDFLRVTISFYDLLKSLNCWGVENGYDFYVGKADYSFGQQEIIDFAKNKQIFGNSFELRDWLKLLCYKRAAFSFENEIRFFAVPKQGSSTLMQGNFLFLDGVDLRTAISKIMLPPVMKETDDCLTKYVVSKDLDFQEERIEKCRLYDVPACPKIQKM